MAAIAQPARANEHRLAGRKCFSQLSDIDRLQADWAEFIVGRFATEADAARAFGVTVRTIQNWQKQTVPPSGLHIYRAVWRFGFFPNV